jgi:poly(3-hydroxybutyrate) depolymerase
MKHTLPLTLLFCFLMGAISLQAQNAGCNGIRYKTPVFNGVKMTTVKYAPTTTILGLSMDLHADVYEPDSTDQISARPVIILAHGGSFIFGDKSDMAAYCTLLAKEGYIAASIEYRLYPILSLGYPDSSKVMDAAVKAVGDMKAAVRFFRENAATTNTFRVDANHIFIGGYSAGAVTALHAAYLDSHDTNVSSFITGLLTANGGLEGQSGTSSNKTYSSSSLAVLNMSGGLYRHQWIDSLSVPLMSIHGTADATVPYVDGLAAGLAYLQGSSLLHAQATAVGVWNNLVTVPGGGHTDTYSAAQFAPYVDTFFVHASALMESLTCQLVSTSAPAKPTLAFQVIPNPVAGNTVALQLPDDAGIARVTIINTEGKVVFQASEYQSMEILHLPVQLTGGVYTVLIEAKNQFGVRQLLKL